MLYQIPGKASPILLSLLVPPIPDNMVSIAPTVLLEGRPRTGRMLEDDAIAASVVDAVRGATSTSSIIILGVHTPALLPDGEGRVTRRMMTLPWPEVNAVGGVIVDAGLGVIVVARPRVNAGTARTTGVIGARPSVRDPRPWVIRRVVTVPLTLGVVSVWRGHLMLPSMRPRLHYFCY